MDNFLTKNQQLILKTFELHPEHLTAQQTYAYLHQDYPKIGLATVYRTLDSLVKLGKLQRLVGLEETVHYDHRLDAHAHFFCASCHKVMDLDAGLVPALSKAELARHLGCVCHSIELDVHGVCSECKH